MQIEYVIHWEQNFVVLERRGDTVRIGEEGAISETFVLNLTKVHWTKETSKINAKTRKEATQIFKNWKNKQMEWINNGRIKNFSLVEQTVMAQ